MAGNAFEKVRDFMGEDVSQTICGNSGII